MPNVPNMAIKTRWIPDLVYWLLIAITAANYSFITFTYDGSYMESGPLKPIAFLRLPIAVFGYFYLLAVERKKGGFDIGDLLLGIIVLSAVIGLPLSPDYKNSAIYGFWFIVQVAFIFRYISYLNSKGGYDFAKRKIVYPLMFMGMYFILLALGGLPNYSIGQPFPAIFSHRSPVAQIAPLYLGGFACLYQSIMARKSTGLIYIGFAVFCLALIAVSGKRASMLSAIIIGASYYLFVAKGSSKILALLVVPLLVVVIAFTGFQETAQEATEYSRVRIEKGFDSDTATSINARFAIWEFVGDLVVEYPTGIGINSGRALVGGGLHNTYLGYLLEIGWLGFMGFMAILYLACHRGFFGRLKPKREMLFFILAPCMLYSFTEYNSSPGQPLFIPFWVAIAFCSLPNRRVRRRVSPAPSTNP